MMGTTKGYSIVIVSTLIVWTVIEYVASNYSQMATKDFIVPAKTQHVELSESVESPQCPDVNMGMMRGRWRPRTLTAQEKVNIDTFLKSVRYRVPKPMQRRDGKCGNVAYKNTYLFRALCNPEGATPCCYGNKCRKRSPDDCKCPKCYDLRNEIHAEYSTWEPEDSRCQVKNFTAQQACNLLQGLTVAVIGDSFMRHLYTALVLLMNNYNSKDVFRAGKPGGRGCEDTQLDKKPAKGGNKIVGKSGGCLQGIVEIRTYTLEIIEDGRMQISCHGMKAFSDKTCRAQLIRTATLCNGSLNVDVSTIPRASEAAKFHEKFRPFLHRKNTVILVGIGIHDHFNFDKVLNEYIHPVIDLIRKSKASWPKLIWFATHKFGIMKSPMMPKQENSHVVAFNKRMSEALEKYHIPIFDTYNLTSGVMSLDGAHFGIGVNSMKVQMLLNYLLEFKSKLHW